ncbi:MAG: zinc metalloprotease HtpX [Legionellales bacterium]|nr:zinc metalloprotease HtpX [Legionellales bacterium]
MNMMKTTLLLGGLTGLLLVIGGLLGGKAGMLIALVIAAFMNLGAYWFSDKLVLSMYHATEVDASDRTGLYQAVMELSGRANIPMPKVYLIEDDMPNAFATGRNPENASVAATTGLMARLNKQEIMGVMAHELTHVRHRDTLISAIAATIGGAISMLANFAMWSSIFGGNRDDNHGSVIGEILMMVLAPMAAGLIQMAVSRSREYAADAGGAALCGNPLWLASALEKLEATKHTIHSSQTETHPATAHLFIVNPLQGEKIASLFSTHPSTQDRIARLQEMARSGQYRFD